jgi:hypothetical protein
VEERVRDLDARRPQVRVEVREPRPRDEALVDERPRRRGHDRERLAEARRARGRLQAPTQHDEPALEVAIREENIAMRGARSMEEHLGERRPARAGRPTERRRLGGHDPPVDDPEAELPDDVGGSASRHVPRRPTGPRQEQLEDGRSFGRPGGVEAEGRQDAAVQRHRDAGAVGRSAVRAERAAMGQRREPAQRQRKDLGPMRAARVRDEPDPARVVLERGVVQRRAITEGATARAALWGFEGHPVRGSVVAF